MKEIKLIEKLKDRYNIVIIILTLIFLVIVFRLATLTLVEGDEYRKLSDTKRVKQIPITSPRGNIRDRYGRLLAGTKPSFTVQIMKDEIDSKNLNDTALELVKLLEEHGETYVDEFPIQLNSFSFANEDLYIQSNENPMYRVVDTLISNGLVGELIQKQFKYEKDGHEYNYLIGNVTKMILENKGSKIPINIYLNNSNEVVFSFNETMDIEKWKFDNELPIDIGPRDALVQIIDNDKNILNTILSKPIIRKVVFDILTTRGLINDVKVESHTFIYDEEYTSIKKDLIKTFEDIKMDSSAKDDFASIVKQTIIGELLENVTERTITENEVERIIPGQILLDMLNENNIILPITIKIDENTMEAKYSYKDEESKKSFHTKENLSEEVSARDALIYVANKTGYIDKIILSDEVKSIAQELVLNSGINPKISIANWEYVSINNKRNWLTKHNIPEDSNAEEALIHLREKYDIDEKLSDYEVRYILLIREQLQKQGYRAYQPVNIAYGIKDETIAKVAESNLDLPGVKVSIEPIRYYPMGQTAAHILGYLGKISQSFEIKKYIEESGYSPNDIIGKSGVEEKFEEYLNGVDGSRYVEVDVMGNTINVLDEKKAIPGNDLYLTIDGKLQQTAEAALKHGLEELQKGGEFQSKWGNFKFGINKKEGVPYKNATSGALVALDVKTGEVLALASYPSYDPNLFVTGISTADYESLKPENEEDLLAPRPLLNIALQTAVQPGSIFKMITGLAALEEGISPNKKITDYGYIDIGTQRFGCWIWNDRKGAHGPENLYEAIRDSCNYYFYTVTLGKNLRSGESIGIKVDEEDIFRVAKEFGLDDKTGIEINIPREASGGVPDPEDKARTSKTLLRRFLNENVRSYIQEEVSLTNKEINDIIEEIVSWLDLEEEMTRGEVYKGLLDLKIDPDKKIEGQGNLTDIIKYTYLIEAKWSTADTLNISIGQGQNSYTPIQMANYIATLANGGYRNKVSVVQKVESYDKDEIKYLPEKSTERVNLKDYNFLEDVKKGMAMGGESYNGFRNFPIKIAAKTGTAEKDGINPATGEEYDNFAWFAAFAPYDDPQIAVVSIIFQGGSGGYNAPIVREVIAEYLGLNDENQEFTLENKMVR